MLPASVRHCSCNAPPLQRLCPTFMTCPALPKSHAASLMPLQTWKFCWGPLQLSLRLVGGLSFDTVI